MSARAAVTGIGYQLWRRTRWMLLVTLAQIVALVLAVHVFPARDTFPLVGVALISLMMITVPFFVQVFTYAGDMSSPESGFPRHMMVLPLSASTLAMIPMLYGIGLMTLLWVVVAKLVFVPLGAPALGVWSMLVPGAAITWLCAISWMPFWFSFARVIASVGVLSALVTFLIAARVYSISEWITIAVLLGAIVLAFVLAVGGVARARRGDGTVPPWGVGRTAGVKSVPRLKPFASAERAQIWFELRRNCTMAALFVFPMIGALAFLPWMPSQHLDLVDLYVAPVPFMATMISVVMPVLWFGVVGGNFARPDAWDAKMTAPAFLTARPTSDRFLVSAKIKAATLTIAVLWAIVLANIALSLLFPHGSRETESLAHFLMRHAVIAVASIAALMLYSWTAVLKSFAMSLYGSKWIPAIWVFATIILVSLAPWLGYWVWKHPERRAVVLLVARVLVGALIAAKIAAALPIIRALRRYGVASDARLVVWTAGWFLAAVGLLIITVALVPAARHSGVALAAGVVLFLPYNRMISMPLAWHHNRHR